MICLEDGYRRADRLLWQRVSVRETRTEAELKYATKNSKQIF